MDKDAQVVGIVRQGIVRAAADHNAGSLLRNVADGVEGGEIHLLLQRVPQPAARQGEHVRVHGDGVQQAFGPLVKVFHNFLAEAAFIGRLPQKLLIVKRNPQLLGHADAHFLAAAAKLPANGDHCVHTDASSLGKSIIPLYKTSVK